MTSATDDSVAAIQPVTRNSKVLIVDGLNLFIRMFAATSTLNGEGKHIGGIVGFIKNLAHTIEQHKPTRVVICFDGVGGSSRRRAIYSEYKENRKVKTRLNRFYDFASVEDERGTMEWELKILVYLLQYLPVTVITADHVEADDVIAYLAKHTVELGGRAMIMSGDKDFLQLVANPHIVVWNGQKKKVYTITHVLADFGIHPANLVTFRTMDGDKSDNINGIYKMGIATALKYFPELADEVPVTIDDIITKAQRLVEEIPDPPQVLLHTANAKTLLERNFKLMQLADASMSTLTRISVLEKFNANIPELNKVVLTKCLITGKMLGAFDHWDDMLRTSFVRLMRYTGDAHR